MSHDWSHRAYAVIPYPPAEELWAEILEEQATCRKSLDESLVLVKWEGATPALLAGVTTYDHAGILALLAGAEWTDPDEDPPE